MPSTTEPAAASSSAEHFTADHASAPVEETTARNLPLPTSSSAAAEAAAAMLEGATNPGERDHIERDVSNILAGLNQEQLASIVAAARASEARNGDAPASEGAAGFGEGVLPAGLGQAASALTSIASGFKRTHGNDRTNLGTADADGKEVATQGGEFQEEKEELDADTTAAIAAVKNATDTATAAAIASLGSLAAASHLHQPSTQEGMEDDSMDYDSPNGDSGSPSRNLKRSRGPELDRQRKDNHKEVERRRRSAINDGIVQLSHIVPGCDAKNTNKGAIIHAAVRYIQDLKHNEASNIEKWTLEKLLMDQAMGDLTAQLDEARAQVERLRAELEGEGRVEGDGKA